MRTALPWLVPLAGIAALLFFLSRTADTAPTAGHVVISAPPVAGRSPTPVLPEPLPDLIRITLDGPRSIALFRLADGSDHAVALHQILRPGWTLTALDSGSATLATPEGPRRIPLSAAAMAPEKPATKAVLVPDAPARAADGAEVSRCTDPEC